MIKTKCYNCGKEIEIDDNFEHFEEILCEECETYEEKELQDWD